MRLNKNFIRLILMAGLACASALSQACPDYFTGEYRHLHSSKSVDLCALTENKVVMVVNTASHCGFTSQFKEMEAVYQEYKDQGLVIVGFASDDFKQEDDDEAKAAEICFLNYGVTFTMLAPTHVRGDDANPLFKSIGKMSSAPSWNFNKYLFDTKGNFVAHFGSRTKPDSKDLTSAIETLLSKPQ